MTLKWTIPLTLAVALAYTGSGLLKARASPTTAPVAGAQDHDRDDDWAQAPGEFREAQRKGFRDGVEAARHDFDHRRHADADDHGSYRHPPVSHDERGDYREGFRRGYERAMAHLNGEQTHDRY